MAAALTGDHPEAAHVARRALDGDVPGAPPALPAVANVVHAHRDAALYACSLLRPTGQPHGSTPS